MNAVKRPERKIRALSLITANEAPESFSGTGKHYIFFFHPEKLQLFYAEVGTWVS